jgi:hypothetical protein
MDVQLLRGCESCCLDQILNSTLECIGQSATPPRAQSNLKDHTLAFLFGVFFEPLVT